MVVWTLRCLVAAVFISEGLAFSPVASHSFSPGFRLPRVSAASSHLPPSSALRSKVGGGGEGGGGGRDDRQLSGLRMTDRPGGQGRDASESDGSRGRRTFLLDALRAGAGLGAVMAGPRLPADALAQLKTPQKEALSQFDVPRDAFLDDAFARGMATGMLDYEEVAASRKRRLFNAMLSSVPRNGAVIAEVGIGSFPNAPFFASREAPQGMDIIGIDPNDRMGPYALDNARRFGIIPKKGRGGMVDPSKAPNSLRIVHGVSEALPLDDASCDAVVCSLTLCSVIDQQRSLAEIKRVLKPGGKFVFWEHVLSETDPKLARQQIELTPGQVRRADGCHLDRRTGESIKAAGFSKIDLDYFELENFGFLNPTVAGIATV